MAILSDSSSGRDPVSLAPAPSLVVLPVLIAVVSRRRSDADAQAEPEETGE